MPPVIGSLMVSWSRGRAIDRVRSILLCLAFVVGFAVFANELERHIPFRNWLFLRYAKYWLAVGFWTGSMLTFGTAVLSRLRVGTRGIEHGVLSFAIGLLGFYWVQFVGGWFGTFRPYWFVVGPLILFALGIPNLLRQIQGSVWRSGLGTERLTESPRFPRSVITFLITGVGAVAVVAIYVNILTPENVAFDSRWYHLGLAEQYAVSGHLMRFREGWFMGAYPQLASFLYTWAFLMPGAQFFDKLQLAAHMEFVVFLWTLAGMVPLVRALVPGASANQAWVAFFLFPGIFLYDSSLSVGADHIAAFWAVPIVLCLVRAYKALDATWCSLLAVFVGGAVSTKYSAISLLVFPVAALLFRALQLGGRKILNRRPSELWAVARPVVLAAVAGTAITAPHWAKNWRYYGDPLYPLLHDYFPSQPFVEGMDHRLKTFIEMAWRPERNLDGVLEALRGVYRFSFYPNNWPWMHGKMPVFGSLFTLSVLCLPFLPRRLPRLWGLYLGVHMGLFAWYWLAHEDRYLQALLPWMAACVAAVLITLVRESLATRVLASAWVGLQVAWGLFVYFIPTHGMIHQAPIKLVADFAASSFNGTQKQYLEPYSNFTAVRDYVGEGAVLLLHEQALRVGFGVRGVQDRGLHQGALIYGRLKSLREVYTALQALEVTHVLWTDQSNESSLADDLVFRTFWRNALEPPASVRSWAIARMPSQAPSDQPFNSKVIMNPCPEDGYSVGVYELSQLYVMPYTRLPLKEYPKPGRALSPRDITPALAAESGYVVWNRACSGSLPATLRAGLVQIGSRGDYELWAHR